MEALALGNESEWDAKLDDQIHPDLAGMTHEMLSAFHDVWIFRGAKKKKKTTTTGKKERQVAPEAHLRKAKMEITWAEL